MIKLLDYRTKSDAALAPTREYRPGTALTRRLAMEGVQTFSLFQLPPGLADAERFRSLVEGATASHGAWGACLHVYEATEYATMRLFTDSDGMAGFALDGQDVVSVFCHKDRRKRHATRTMMPLAVSLGGTYLNAFDTFLPRLYAQSGFKPVARLDWDDRQAPSGWDYGVARLFNGGRPDVVFMTHSNRAPVVRRVGSFEAGELLQRLTTGTSFVEVNL